VRTDRVRAITGVQLAAADPAALAARWSEILDRPVRRASDDQLEIALSPGRLRFGRAPGAAPHVGGYELAVVDRDRVLETARGRGLAVSGDTVTIAGTQLRMV
jgi:hypothetical protein